MKLLKPRTRIATPVKRTTPARSASNASMSAGNMGARASGPKPCVNETDVAAEIQSAFHIGDQFCRLLA